MYVSLYGSNTFSCHGVICFSVKREPVCLLLFFMLYLDFFLVFTVKKVIYAAAKAFDVSTVFFHSKSDVFYAFKRP